MCFVEVRNMSQKITDFFKNQSTGSKIERKSTVKKINNLLDTPFKRKKELENEVISVSSSDEETNLIDGVKLKSIAMQRKHASNRTELLTPCNSKKAVKINVVRLCSSDEGPNVFDHGQRTPGSDSSDKTVIYSISPVSCNNSEEHYTPPKPSTTPKLNKPLTLSNMYYSPSKKRMISKQSPSKVCRNLNSSFMAKELYVSTEVQFKEMCEGYCDKTKFLLTIVNDCLKDESLSSLLSDTDHILLGSIPLLYKPGANIVCRLFWRQLRWYRKTTVLDIVRENKYNQIKITCDEDANAMLNDLVKFGFLVKGDEENMKQIEEFTEYLLRMEELHEICKVLKIKRQSNKENCIEALRKRARESNIGSFFTNGPVKNNSGYVLKLMRQAIGPCYKLTDKAYKALHELYILSYIGIGYQFIREKRLEQLLMLEKINKETFPIKKDVYLDKASIVFRSQEEFAHYVMTLNLYENFLASEDSQNNCVMVQQIFKLYNSITEDQMQSYRCLPEWLRRFTSAYLYIKIMEMAIVDLKKEKTTTSLQFALEVLNVLLQQSLFRQRKKAEWYNEKALILHKYLHNHHEAAQVLIEGFQLNVPEEHKDLMRKRALIIANQKNITLDENLKHSLILNGTKPSTLESTLPHVFFYKLPMENNKRVKVKYETRSLDGITVQEVEDYAMSCYLNSNQFTHGGHWESKIITNLFFLLFWDIIYSNVENVGGIFLSYYQRFPLDLYSDSFYRNRCKTINDRLSFIEVTDMILVVALMESTWNNRPESELSGLSKDVSLSHCVMVAKCLGSQSLSAICRRLATNYHYTHSGFPDLTLYNVDKMKIKFVEVKSDNDKPSMKQIQWMQYLMDHGVDTEFCHVGTKSALPKSNKTSN